jgi:osmotically inducible protein OsmC
LLAVSHAGCLSLILGKSGYTPDSLDVTAVVTIDADKLEITGSHLILKVKIPNIDYDQFEESANAAKDNCPISKALSIDITLDARLE